MFRDAEGQVIYVGKAKNLRRRLQNYRAASRRKVHRKMRTLVRESGSLEVRPLASEREALLAENTLIRELKPRYNVDGAFAFLYPAVGLGQRAGHTVLCFTTQPDAYAPLELHWFGAFRSRPRAKAAFAALVELLALVGHVSTRAQLPAHAAVRGSRVVGVRQLPRELTAGLADFFGGYDPALLGALAAALLEKPGARRQAAYVEECLHLLRRFYETDARRLRLALERLDRRGTYVPQDERDALFISARWPAPTPPAP